LLRRISDRFGCEGGHQPKGRYQALIGKDADRCLLGIVEFDARS
jgi:hypothetical protein